MVQLDRGFGDALGAFDLDDLETHAGSIYGLWADGRLAYVNPAWERFALDNGGEPAISTRWGIGCTVIDAVATPLIPFYRRLYDRCLSQAEPQEHLYECSSGRLFRRFHMTVYPLRDAVGLLVVNSIVVERAHEADVPTDADPARAMYFDRNGLIHQCCHCRRFERCTDGGEWVWVPEWVERMPHDTSHGLCPVCFDYHYRPESRAAATSA